METVRVDLGVRRYDIVIGHGNGPQVGFILRRSEIAHRVEGMHELSLDVCGADSQGAIGYALQQNLQNEFRQRGVKKPVATVITQVLVDRNDPAFENPTKPIGGFMDQAEAQRRTEEMGWDVVEDAGRGWRRVGRRLCGGDGGPCRSAGRAHPGSARARGKRFERGPHGGLGCDGLGREQQPLGPRGRPDSGRCRVHER